MAIYEYKCLDCGNHATSETRTSKLESWCPHCPDDKLHMFQRVWSVAMAPIMQEHFNTTIGMPISDQKRFNAELRAAGERATEETGIPHSYAPIDMNDAAAVGADGEGIYEANVARSRRGDPLLPLPKGA